MGIFLLGGSFYTGSFISSHCFKNILNMKMYAFRIFILSQKLHFSHHINLFFHFGFHFSSFMRFLLQYNTFCQIWTICLLRNLSETLPAFIFKNFKNMLHNCYRYPKITFLVTYEVSASVYG